MSRVVYNFTEACKLQICRLQGIFSERTMSLGRDLLTNADLSASTGVRNSMVQSLTYTQNVDRIQTKKNSFLVTYQLYKTKTV